MDATWGEAELYEYPPPGLVHIAARKALVS